MVKFLRCFDIAVKVFLHLGGCGNEHGTSPRKGEMGNKECNNFGPDSESEPISEYWEWCRFIGRSFTIGCLRCNLDYCTHLQAEQGSDHTSLHHVVSTLHNRRKEMGRHVSVCTLPQLPGSHHPNCTYFSTCQHSFGVDHVLNPTVVGLQHKTDCT